MEVLKGRYQSRRGLGSIEAEARQKNSRSLSRGDDGTSTKLADDTCFCKLNGVHLGDLQSCLDLVDGVGRVEGDNGDAGPWVTSKAIMNCQYSLFLPTGSKDLDSLLMGGIRRGQLTEFCGMSASGKTKLCMSVIANTAYTIRKCEGNNAKGENGQKRYRRIVYIDSANSFRATRLADILHNMILQERELDLYNKENDNNCSDEQALSDEVSHMMEIIEVYRPRDVWDTFAILQNLSNECKEERNMVPLLLLIDSLPLILSPTYSTSNTIDMNVASGTTPNAQSNYHVWGQGLAVQLGTMIKALADSYAMAAVVTNNAVAMSRKQTMGDINGPVNSKQYLMPALGSAWISVPHLRIMLQTNLQSDKKRYEEESWDPSTSAYIAQSTFTGEHEILRENANIIGISFKDDEPDNV